MRLNVFVILGLVASLTVGACSSSNETADQKSNVNANTSVVSANSATDGSNSVVVANGMVVQPQTGDANAATAASTDTAAVPPQLEKLRGKLSQGESSETIDPAAVALKNAKPAPDNSTFTSYLSDAGYEIRTFKSHPQIQKVEKRIESSGKQTLKIFLRNGNVVQASGASIPILSTASAASIAAVAGLTQAPAKQPNTGSTGAKKTVN